MKKTIFLGLMLVGLIGGTRVAFGDDYSIIEEISEGSGQTLPYVYSDSVNIYPETQQVLDSLSTEFEGAYDDYMQSIIDLVNESKIYTDDEFNELMINSANQVKEQSTINDSLLNDLNLTLQEEINTTAPKGPSTRMVLGAWVAAEKGWKLGTSIVRNEGYKNTAMYMDHALNGKGATHTTNNNAWAKDVLFNNDIMNQQYPMVKNWIRNSNSKYLNYSGTFAFKTGDKFYALHKVNYAYACVRQPNGGIKTTGTVTDTYDFEWSKYDNIKVGFANNYAVSAQSLGVIKPFKIVIKGVSG